MSGRDPARPRPARVVSRGLSRLRARVRGSQALRRVAARHRNADGELAAVSWCALDRDLSPVAFDDPSDKAQAEARPLNPRGNHVGGAIEGFEDMRLLRRSDPDASIADA